MFLDDLHIWGFLGRQEYTSQHEPPGLHAFRHLGFDISHRGDQVVEANVFTDPATTVDVTHVAGGGLYIKMTYSVNWKEVCSCAAVARCGTAVLHCMPGVTNSRQRVAFLPPGALLVSHVCSTSTSACMSGVLGPTRTCVG